MKRVHRVSLCPIPAKNAAPTVRESSDVKNVDQSSPPPVEHPHRSTTLTTPHSTTTAAYKCSGTMCSAELTNIGGYVDTCEVCSGTNGCAVASSAPSGCANCCQAPTCSTSTTCAFGYRNTGAATPTGNGCTACADLTCLFGGCAECCEPVQSVFPTCAASVGPLAYQALRANDSSWAFRSKGVPFVRFTGVQTGMCFSINLRNTCAGQGPTSACCLPSKPPAFLQLKLPTTVSDSFAVRKSTLNRLDRCRLAYGLATATTNGLKGFPRALEVAGSRALPGTAPSRVFNLPLPTISSAASSIDFCLFTNAVIDPNTQLNCSWESICGLKDGSVPSATTTPFQDRSIGCEVRLIGGGSRRASLPCCSVPMGITAFDGSREAVTRTPSKQG